MAFDENKARYYAKPGCRKCNGKGFQIYSKPTRLEIIEKIKYCACVIKRMRKDAQR